MAAVERQWAQVLTDSLAARNGLPTQMISDELKNQIRNRSSIGFLQLRPKTLLRVLYAIAEQQIAFRAIDQAIAHAFSEFFHVVSYLDLFRYSTDELAYILELHHFRGQSLNRIVKARETLAMRWSRQKKGGLKVSDYKRIMQALVVYDLDIDQAWNALVDGR